MIKGENYHKSTAMVNLCTKILFRLINLLESNQYRVEQEMVKELNRKELYKLVWSKPITEAAKEYGLSDRGLSKICERNTVPVPPRGYWAKIKAGQKIKIPSLISLDKIDNNILLSVKTVKKADIAISDDFKELIQREKLPKYKISVPDCLSNYHQIIAQWNKIDLKRQLSGQERRRRKILSVLLDSLDERGFVLEEESGGKKRITINYQQSSVIINVEPYVKCYRQELKNENNDSFYSTGRKWTFVKEATQKLVLNIYYVDGFKIKSFIESENDPLEKSLNKIIIYVIKRIWKEQQSYLEREELHYQWEKERQIRQNENEIQKLELNKIAELEENLKSWQHAQDIRNFVQSMVISAKTQDLSDWQQWALYYADKVDPTIMKILL